MATADVLAPNVLIEAPSCSAMLAERVIMEAARDFCRETDAIRRSVAGSLAANEPEFTLTLPAGVSLINLISVFVDDRKLKLVTTEEARASADWNRAGTPRTVCRTGNTLRFSPMPSEVMAIEVFYSASPDSLTLTLDDELVERWGDVLVWGALGRLLTMPQRAWTNPQLAIHYAALYRMKLDDIRQRAESDNQRGITTTIRYGGY